jgi:vacuolar protein sorting-associated protein 11
VPVSTVAAHETHGHLAVGLIDGVVLLYRGDLAHERFSNKPPRVLHEGTTPVTGLHFRPSGRDEVLFVVTVSSVQSYFLNRKDHREELEEFGCELGCSVISETDGSLVVGRAECLYSYEAEGRGGALGFEGEKKMLAWFRNYLVIVGREGKRAGGGGATSGASSASSKIHSVTIYDTRNKFIAFTASLSDVTQVFSEWGTLFVLQGDGKLFQLTEKDFQTKLELLYTKHLYDIAINLAKTQQSGEEANETLVEIYQKYAAHLYGKYNFNEAIAQYIKTIGFLEPSYVIRKFLDSQRIHNLTAYLQALHEKELADKHHTTLLLNCYTKVRGVCEGEPCQGSWVC